MAITWTKYWTGADDGTIVRGVDLKNVQDDVAAGTVSLETSPTQGDILYYNGTNWVVLNAGTAGKMLQTNGAAANPSWGYLTITDQEQGDVLYYNGTNWVVLHHGTDGQFLKSKGHGANPEWGTVPDVNTSNVIWRSPYLNYKGASTLDQRASIIHGSTSIVGTVEAGSTYGDYFGRAIPSTDTFEDVITAERWLRISGVTTVTVHGYLWVSTAPTLGKLKVTITDGSNTATTTINGTAAGQGAPEYVTGTMSVSTLSTSTVSTISVAVSINQNGGGDNSAYCGGIVLLGS